MDLDGVAGSAVEMVDVPEQSYPTSLEPVYGNDPRINATKLEPMYENNPRVIATKLEPMNGDNLRNNATNLEPVYEDNPRINATKLEPVYGDDPTINATKLEPVYGDDPRIDAMQTSDYAKQLKWECLQKLPTIMLKQVDLGGLTSVDLTTFDLTSCLRSATTSAVRFNREPIPKTVIKRTDLGLARRGRKPGRKKSKVNANNRHLKLTIVEKSIVLNDDFVNDLEATPESRGTGSTCASPEPKKFPCAECDKSFARKVSLNHHVFTKHGTHNMIQCLKCRKWLLDECSLASHTKYVHSPPSKAKTPDLDKAGSTPRSLYDDEFRSDPEGCLPFSPSSSDPLLCSKCGRTITVDPDGYEVGKDVVTCPCKLFPEQFSDIKTMISDGPLPLSSPMHDTDLHLSTIELRAKPFSCPKPYDLDHCSDSSSDSENGNLIQLTNLKNYPLPSPPALSRNPVTSRQFSEASDDFMDIIQPAGFGSSKRDYWNGLGGLKTTETENSNIFASLEPVRVSQNTTYSSLSNVAHTTTNPSTPFLYGDLKRFDRQPPQYVTPENKFHQNMANNIPGAEADSGQNKASANYQQPITAHDQQRTTAEDQQPVTVHNQQPITVLNQQPITVHDQQPITAQRIKENESILPAESSSPAIETLDDTLSLKSEPLRKVVSKPKARKRQGSKGSKSKPKKAVRSKPTAERDTENAVPNLGDPVVVTGSLLDHSCLNDLEPAVDDAFINPDPVVESFKGSPSHILSNTECKPASIAKMPQVTEAKSLEEAKARMVVEAEAKRLELELAAEAAWKKLEHEKSVEDEIHRKAEEARIKAENEAKREVEEAKRKAEAEKKAEDEAKRKAEAEAREKERELAAEVEKKRQELAVAAEAERKRREARLAAEAEAKRRNEERARKLEEERAKLLAEAEAKMREAEEIKRKLAAEEEERRSRQLEEQQVRDLEDQAGVKIQVVRAEDQMTVVTAMTPVPTVGTSMPAASCVPHQPIPIVLPEVSTGSTQPQVYTSVYNAPVLSSSLYQNVAQSSSSSLLSPTSCTMLSQTPLMSPTQTSIISPGSVHNPNTVPQVPAQSPLLSPQQSPLVSQMPPPGFLQPPTHPTVLSRSPLMTSMTSPQEQRVMPTMVVPPTLLRETSAPSPNLIVIQPDMYHQQTSVTDNYPDVVPEGHSGRSSPDNFGSDLDDLIIFHNDYKLPKKSGSGGSKKGGNDLDEDSSTESEPKPKKKKKSKKKKKDPDEPPEPIPVPVDESLLCQVCGAVAKVGEYYGGRICSSCKIFFSSTVKSGDDTTYVCLDPARSEDEVCHIKPNNRKNCMFCRFKKCVNLGLLRDAVSEETAALEERANKRKRKSSTTTKPPTEGETVPEDTTATAKPTPAPSKKKKPSASKRKRKESQDDDDTSEASPLVSPTVVRQEPVYQTVYPPHGIPAAVSMAPAPPMVGYPGQVFAQHGAMMAPPGARYMQVGQNYYCMPPPGQLMPQPTYLDSNGVPIKTQPSMMPMYVQNPDGQVVQMVPSTEQMVTAPTIHSPGMVQVVAPTQQLTPAHAHAMAPAYTPQALAPAYTQALTPAHTQPAPTYTQPLAPTHPQPPAPTYTQPPAPTHTQLPAPTHSLSPAPAHTQPPTPAHTQSPAPAHTQPPAPAHTQPPTPAHTQPPTPAHTQPPTPAHTQPPPAHTQPSTTPT